jgi:hypothetical protein
MEYVSAVAAALVLGVATALWVIVRPPVMPVIRNGAWVTNLKVGSRDAGMYLRAYIALTGLFALNIKETIYYRASVDDDGEPLMSDRSYVIEGEDIATRWWAIILYGQDNHLIANGSGRHSFNMGNLEREADGGYRIAMSPEPAARNWLPTGDKRQRLSLSLKVYNPDASVYDRPGEIRLPRIRRVTT